MKSIAVEKQAAPALCSSWLDTFARKGVLKLLQKIKVGHLTIEESGQVYCFGESQQETNLIAHISVRHPSAYRYVLLNGTIGSGEAYMLNAWWSADLLQVIRLMVANMSMLRDMDTRWSNIQQWANTLMHKLRVNSKTGSRKNIAAHYDLSNDFFSLFLDPSMLYSAAIYPTATATLEQASKTKLERICQRLQLNEKDHLLEIGSGWGGMAIYAAKHFGCTVTTVTLSRAQFEYAQSWAARENLTDRVTVLLKDYRDIDGVFDKIVSIEMIEAVGYQYYSDYFSACSKLLSPQGKMLLQAITIADQRYELEKHNVDFIQRYIFPGGCLPSVEVIAKHIARDTDMQVVGMEDITFHYAQTLADWRKRFFMQIDAVKKLGFDDVFIRMWDFYLCYCEGGFRERAISTSQWVFAKPQCKELPEVGSS